MTSSRVEVDGVDFDNLSSGQVIEEIHRLAGQRGGLVVTPNLAHLRRCRWDEDLRNLYANAMLTLADGAPVVWLARLKGARLRRVTGADLFPELCGKAAMGGLRVAVVGTSNAEAAEDLTVKLRNDWPNLNVIVISPPMGFEESATLLANLSDRLCAFGPDIVFACLGSPKQEQWARTMMPALPKTVFVGAGASAAFYAGHLKRAPMWIRRVGLEWAFRLVTEPRRLWRRYASDGVYLIGAFIRTLVGGDRGDHA